MAAAGSRRRSSEGGFVLLTLLFFAAAVAFMLLMALPQSAMQAQRVREETLIYRGEQYKRAVQLYFRKYKKYPASLDDLEESDGVRFLRRRYKDPLSGEDQWRLVHMGTDGRFKDSVLFDQPEEGDDAKKNLYARGVGSTFGSSGSAATAFQGAELARTGRESAAPDIPGQGASAADYLAAGLAGQAPADGAAGGDPAAPGGQVPYPNYATTLPSQIPSPTGAGDPTNAAGANNPYGTPAGAVAGQPNPPANQQSGNRRGVDPRQRAMAQPGMIGGTPQAGTPASAPPAGFGSPAMGRSAADLIRNLLTTPRPGGLAGLRGAQAQSNQPSFAEGIAGVASKVEQRGIKVYNEREYYNEWEFVYDYRQDATMAGLMGGAGQPGNINPGQPGLNAGGTLQIDPSQGVPVPAISGFPGMAPGAAQPGGAQPADGSNPYPQPAGTPPLPGASPFDPATGAYPQPGQPVTTPTRPDRNSRRRRGSPPPPLPGQPIYPAGVPNQPPLVPGQPLPFGAPAQPPGDPNQPVAPQGEQQP
jgi:type II secretory pathway pseudopilin PulG